MWKACLWPVLRPETWSCLHRVNPPGWELVFSIRSFFLMFCIFLVWGEFAFYINSINSRHFEIFPPRNVLQVLWQEVLCARDNVERLRAVSAVADLQILVSHTDQPPVVALEHVRVEGGEHGDQQLAVRSIPRELGRCQAFPQVKQALVGQPGGDQYHPSLLVGQ